MALCLLTESEVFNYEELRRFVSSEVHDEAVQGQDILSVVIHTVPGPPVFPAPFAQLFTRQLDSPANIPEKMFVLYYANYYYQVALPFGRSDKARFMAATPKLETIDMPVFPLLIGGQWLVDFGPATCRRVDFTSNKKRQGEEQRFSLSFEQMVPLPLAPVAPNDAGDRTADVKQVRGQEPY